MRFTNSRDDRLRADIRVSHRVGLDDIVNCVCYYLAVLSDVYEPGDEVRLTRSGVSESLQRVLRQEGAEGPAYWSDSAPYDMDTDDLKDQVRSEVLRLYPELKEAS